MPKIIRLIERLDYIIYSGWITDRRPGGLGISNQTKFLPNLKLFTSDIGDIFRTNMKMHGQLGVDRTCEILRIGFHASFSDVENYKRFFEGVSMQFIVGESRVAAEFDAKKINTDVKTDEDGIPIPTYKHGITLFEPERFPTDGTGEYAFVAAAAAEKKGNNSIAIAEREPFHLMVKSDENFFDAMSKIENDPKDRTSYAEVTGLLDIVMSREVQ